jgi:dTDP-4-amino-4,6-dideoxygalactose transaminase
MKYNPFSIVREFEESIAEYTGAPYAVAVDSCTNALYLSLMWLRENGYKGDEITIPSQTYLSVPMSIMRAGYNVQFCPELNKWKGEYQLYPAIVWDSARRLRKNMYMRGQYQCLSFHIRKHLPIGKGGMILTDNPDAVQWLRRARYEGRGELPYKEDDIQMIGWNHYMTPEQAARGLALLQQLPDYNEDLPEPGGYRDLSTFSVFKNVRVI